MHALVVTNMYPDSDDRVRGRFVRDQVEALKRLPDVEIELFAFKGGGIKQYLAAAKTLRKRYRGQHFDVIHAHFGLTGLVTLSLTGTPKVLTLHGSDLSHPRSRLLTTLALPFIDLPAAVSTELAKKIPLKRVRRRSTVLPCGIDTERFRPINRSEARSHLSLEPAGRYLLFPADPKRAEKRYDRAANLAQKLDAELLSLGNIDPELVPFYINAVNAVIVTSEREGFGLACLESLACNVPVISTDVGIATELLNKIDGCAALPFSEEQQWLDLLKTHLASSDSRVEGRTHTLQYSALAMAKNVLAAWQLLRKHPYDS